MGTWVTFIFKIKFIEVILEFLIYEETAYLEDGISHVLIVPSIEHDTSKRPSKLQL